MTLYITTLVKHQMYFLMAKAGEKSTRFKKIFQFYSVYKFKRQKAHNY